MLAEAFLSPTGKGIFKPARQEWDHRHLIHNDTFTAQFWVSFFIRTLEIDILHSFLLVYSVCGYHLFERRRPFPADLIFLRRFAGEYNSHLRCVNEEVVCQAVLCHPGRSTTGSREAEMRSGCCAVKN